MKIKKIRIILFFIFLLSIFNCKYFSKETNISTVSVHNKNVEKFDSSEKTYFLVKKKGGFVNDSKSAVALAKLYISIVYSMDIESDDSIYSAELVNDVIWRVESKESVGVPLQKKIKFLHIHGGKTIVKIDRNSGALLGIGSVK